jgi:predicted dehydrogenase
MKTSASVAAAVSQPTVAVIGAGGIGRHHANWWQVEGARVVGILGRTPESAKVSADKLRALFGFDGAVHTDLSTLLRETRPQIVDVCSPAPLHFDHARMALEHDCHVLCEKPLVFDRSLPHARLRGQAAELAELAAARRLRLGLCSQFAMAARACAELRRAQDDTPLTSLHLELRSPARGRLPDPSQTWVDLGPHLLAILQTLLPGTEPEWAARQVEVSGHDIDLRVTLRPAGAPAVEARLQVGFTAGDPANVRRLVLNEQAFDLIGESGDDRLFRMRYRTAGGLDEVRPDPMRLLIRAFLDGHPPLGPQEAVANERMLLRVLGGL